MPPWVSVVVLAQVKEWSKIRDERVLDSHVGSSIKPSREQVQTLGNGVVGLVGESRVEQVRVVSNLYGMGMAGGVEVCAGKDGKGNGVVEDTSVCLDVRVRLREKESGPRFWVKLDKVRSNEQLGA